MGKKVATLDDLIERVVRETRKIRDQTPEEREIWLKSQWIIPPNIPLGDGRFIFTSNEGVGALCEFGRRWRLENAERRRLIGEEQVAQLAVQVFGEMVDGIAEGSSAGKTSAKKIFKERLAERLAAIGTTLVHYLPCHIFDQSNERTFEVGPVRFVQREIWLEEVAERAGKGLSWVNCVGDHWAGRGEVLKPNLELLAASRPPEDPWAAWTVTQAVDKCRWIAVVEVAGREQLRSRECAEAAVRIALDTIGLPLSPRSARDIRGPGDETKARLTQSLMQVAGADLISSSYSDMPSLRGPPGFDVALLHQTAELRQQAGVALRTLVEASPSSKIPRLHQRWLEAIYWFGEARREPVEFIGLVKAGICLDVLAKGGAAEGIIELCCGLFDKKPDDRITSDGHDLQTIVKTIYNEGRSQLSHGGHLGLLHDLPFRRDIAVMFVAQVVARYVERLYCYTGPDEYEDFGNSLPSLR
jgi:hypothetical protein